MVLPDERFDLKEISYFLESSILTSDILTSLTTDYRPSTSLTLIDQIYYPGVDRHHRHWFEDWCHQGVRCWKLLTT